jgi:hypothetical protein
LEFPFGVTSSDCVLIVASALWGGVLEVSMIYVVLGRLLYSCYVGACPVHYILFTYLLQAAHSFFTG